MKGPNASKGDYVGRLSMPSVSSFPLFPSPFSWYFTFISKVMKERNNTNTYAMATLVRSSLYITCKCTYKFGKKMEESRGFLFEQNCLLERLLLRSSDSRLYVNNFHAVPASQKCGNCAPCILKNSNWGYCQRRKMMQDRIPSSRIQTLCWFTLNRRGSTSAKFNRNDTTLSGSPGPEHPSDHFWNMTIP